MVARAWIFERIGALFNAVPELDFDLVGLRRLWRAIFGRVGKLGAVVQSKLEGPDRASDVFDAMFTQILEGDRQFVTNMVSYPARHADATRLGEGLETSSNIDAIAEDVPILDHHIADIEADTELHTAVFRRSVVSLGEQILDLDGRLGGVEHAGELGEYAVAGRSSDASSMPGDNLSIMWR